MLMVELMKVYNFKNIDITEQGDIVISDRKRGNDIGDIILDGRTDILLNDKVSVGVRIVDVLAVDVDNVFYIIPVSRAYEFISKDRLIKTPDEDYLFSNWKVAEPSKDEDDSVARIDRVMDIYPTDNLLTKTVKISINQSMVLLDKFSRPKMIQLLNQLDKGEISFKKAQEILSYVNKKIDDIEIERLPGRCSVPDLKFYAKSLSYNNTPLGTTSTFENIADELFETVPLEVSFEIRDDDTLLQRILKCIINNSQIKVASGNRSYIMSLINAVGDGSISFNKSEEFLSFLGWKMSNLFIVDI